MLNPKSLIVSLAITSLSVKAIPVALNSRGIEQTRPASTTKWVAACKAAGGADQCSTISETAIQSLVAGSDPCAPQDAADKMIDLAKTLNNNADMISLAKIFVQQPLDSSDSLAVPYCQKAPRNTELEGFFHCQFKGATQNTFTGNLAVGATGTIPYGLTTAVNPAGGCPAYPAGPVPDGTQLTDIVSAPGTVTDHSGPLNNRAAPPAGKPPVNGKPKGKPPVIPTTSPTAPPPKGPSPVPARPAPRSDGDSKKVGGKPNGKPPAKGRPPVVHPSGTAPPPAGPSPATAPPAPPAPRSFGDSPKENGLKARSANKQRDAPAPSSPCIEGQEACIGNATAKCINGKYALTQCPSNTICTPLSTNPGPSVSCKPAAPKRDASIANLFAL